MIAVLGEAAAPSDPWRARLRQAGPMLGLAEPLPRPTAALPVRPAESLETSPCVRLGAGLAVHPGWPAIIDTEPWLGK